MRTKLLSLVALLLVLGWAVQSGAGEAGNKNPGVIPPQAKYLGKTYGEWHALWWQWADGMQNAQSPVCQASGEVDPRNQISKQVWFLAGWFGDWFVENTPVEITRTITVPEGTALFFPILNGELTPAEYEEYVASGGDLTAEEYLASWFAEPEAIQMVVRVDGQELADVGVYRAASPEPYTIHLPPEDNHMPGYYPVGGKVDGVLCDGFCVLLAPLPAGQHRIYFEATLYDLFSLRITYEVTVARH